MDCEVCGKPGAKIDALIEGVKMRVCEECAKLSKQILYVEPEPKEKKEEKSYMEVEVDVIEDYGQKIKEAREKNNLTRRELAELVGEKESYLRRIEEEKAIPEEKLVRKLEKILKIKLLEEVSVERKKTKAKKEEITLGDIVEVKKKEKKE